MDGDLGTASAKADFLRKIMGIRKWLDQQAFECCPIKMVVHHTVILYPISGKIYPAGLAKLLNGVGFEEGDETSKQQSYLAG